MRLFLFGFFLLLTGCASSQPTVPGNEVETQWTCEHLYSPWERTYSFDPENIQIVEVQDCPEIIMNGGSCPVYIRIVDNDGKEIWLTEDEWENYTCTIEEKQ